MQAKGIDPSASPRRGGRRGPTRSPGDRVPRAATGSKFIKLVPIREFARCSLILIQIGLVTMLLSRLFERTIPIGRPRVIDARGSLHTFGVAGIQRGHPAARSGPPLETRCASPIFRQSLYGWRANYREGSLYDLIDLLVVNLKPRGVLDRLLNGSSLCSVVFINTILCHEPAERGPSLRLIGPALRSCS